MNDQNDFDSLHPLQKRRAVALLREHGERQKALNPITDYYDERRTPVYEIHTAGNIHLAEIGRRGTADHLFEVWVDMKNAHLCAETFDQALLTALCRKYGSEAATFYAARMIGMPTGM